MKIKLNKQVQIRKKQAILFLGFLYFFNGIYAQCTVNGPSKFISKCGSSYTLNTGRKVTSSGLYTDSAIGYQGCDSIFQVRVSLNSLPLASIALSSDRSQCLTGNSYSFSFNGNALTSNYTVSWNFGDGSALGSGTSVTKSFSTANTFKTILTLTNDSGCVDTESYTVFVRPQPTVAYTVNNLNQCLKGNNFSFTNASGISSGSLSYLWSFGDGSSNATTTNASRKYLADGNYSVKLIATSSFDCKDSNTKSLNVYPQVSSISASVDNSALCKKGNEFNFTGSASISSGTLSYSWNFGDATTATTQNPKHSYTNANNYTARFITNSNNNCKDTASVNLTVYPQANAAFTVNQVDQCDASNKFTFNNTSGIASPGSPLSFAWDLGDGSTASTTNVTDKFYANIQSYTVKLFTESANGCKDTATRSIAVHPNPVASFTKSSSALCKSGNSFTFSNTSSISGATALSNAWNFGDGSAISSTASPTKSYNVANTYNIRLITTSVKGCKDTADDQVTVHPQTTVAFDINANSQCFDGHSVNLTDKSTIQTPGTGTYTNFWRLGDGNSASTTDVTGFTYAKTGTYTVKLITTTDNNCKDSLAKTLTIHPEPTAGFTINNNDQCLTGNNFQFTNTSSVGSPSTMTYSWNMGDGSATKTATNPSHVYTTAGTYTVTLTVTSTGGCTDVYSTSVIVRPKANLDFTFANDQRCFNQHVVNITNNSSVISPLTLSYAWSFGDGTTATTQDITNKTYTTHGNYYVKLTTTTSQNCVDTLRKLVTIYPEPKAKYSYNDSDQCFRNNQFNFTNQSSVATGTFNQTWYYGDLSNSKSTGLNGSKAYAAVGSYNVKLVVVTNGGCKDSVTKNMTVYKQATPDFTFSTSAAQCFSVNKISFNNASTVDNPLTLSYFWRLGDGSTATTTDIVDKVYTSHGVYNVTLRTTTNEGCLDSITKTMTVYPEPTANFSANSFSQCLKGNVANLTNTTQLPTGSYSSVWHLGEGSAKQTNTNASYKYTNHGTYTIKLVVTTNGGCKDSINKDITIHPQATPSFTIDDNKQCLTGNAYAFTNTSSIVSGTLSYVWQMADGSANKTTQDATHTYSSAGTFNPRLISTSNFGCKDTATLPLTVDPQTSTNFSINSVNQCIRNNKFNFTNTSVVGTPGGTFTSDWQLGDGRTETTTNVNNVIYATVKSYSVKLQTTTNFGCIDSVRKTVFVHYNPVASFTIDDNLQCLKGNKYNFTNGSTITDNSALTYQWLPGDGSTTLTTNNASRVYTVANSYNVRLIAISNQNCRDTADLPVTVYPQTNIGFNINTVNQCLYLNDYSFTNTSAVTAPGGTLTYDWNLGDGTTATSTSISAKRYNIVNPYSVRLITTTDNGCIDTLTKGIEVHPHPVASFTINDDEQCKTGNAFSFTNGTTITAGTLSYQWNVGDASATQTATNGSRTYVAAGTYNIRLLATSNQGCTDTADDQVTVFPQTAIGFDINNAGQCFDGHTFDFTNNSSVVSPGGTYTSSWNLGDGDTRTTASVTSKTYLLPAVYSVKLETTTDNGCIDSLRKSITVYPEPTATFSINNDKQCLTGNLFNYTNTTSLLFGSYNSNWTVGDGSSAQTTKNASRTYASAGDYTVRLEVTTNGGCTDAIDQVVTVYPQASPSFTVTDKDQCFNTHSMNYTNTSSVVSPRTLTYEWNLGDGTSSTSTDVTNKTYSVANFYKVILKSTTDQGCVDTFSHMAYVFPEPDARFGFNDSDQCYKGNQFVFTNATALAFGTYSSRWELGDLSSNKLTTNASHKYTGIGNYDVELMVTTNGGCKDSITKNVTIYPQADAVDFDITSIDNQCLRGNSFTYKNQSTFSAGSLTYLWMFGDGTTATSTDASHAYSTAGTFPVKLATVTNNNCKDTTSKNIVVHPQTAISFTHNGLGQCFDSHSFNFTNTSTVSTGNFTYDWSLGDGSAIVSNSAITGKTYATDQKYTVLLTNTTDKGCVDTLTKVITVYPEPTAAFSTNNDKQCLSVNNFQFDNQSSIPYGTLTYQWSAGDNSALATSEDFSRVYGAKGSYSVRLIVKSNGNCIDSAKQTVIVHPQATIAYSINTAQQCLTGNSYSFTNSSSISNGSLSYQWIVGDGSAIQTTQNASRVYNNDGSYSVKLITKSDQNCFDSLTKAVIVHPQTQIAFGINDYSQCIRGNSFQFTNQSAVALGNFSSSWNVGDGSSIQTSANASRTYATVNKFRVKLTTTTDKGCIDTLGKWVHTNYQSAPAFSFNTQKQCLTGNSYTFTNASTIPSGSLTYSWNFADASSSVVTSPTKVYTTAGTYKVVLTATSDSGCIDTVSKTIVVHAQPAISFAINDSIQCFASNNFVFTNNTTVANATIVRYRWAFGNGYSAVRTNARQTYDDTGIYKVVLYAESNLGCTDTGFRWVSVRPEPTADFAISSNDSQCLKGNNFSFTNNSSIPSGLLSYQWKFSGEGQSVNTNSSFTFNSHGNKSVRLIATSQFGCVDSVDKGLVVHPQAVPQFTINNDSQCYKGNAFTYTSTTTIPTGTINAYNWTVGDGSTAQTTANATRTYATYGSYTVTLRTTSNYDCKDTVSQLVVVHPQTVPNFTINNDSQCYKGNAFTYTSTTTIPTGSLKAYNWTVGDGSTAQTTANAIRTYATYGSYTVTLRTTCNYDCKDTTSQLVVVHPQTVPNFTINNDSQCYKGNAFTYTSTTTIPTGTIKSYNWTVGDGSTAQTTANATRTYATYGSYTVTLRTTSNYDCKDTTSQLVVVHPQTVPNFTINNDSQCYKGNAFTYTSTTTIPTGTIKSYNWTVGDGSTAQTTANATRTYATYGSYTVTLRTTSNYDCKDTTSQLVVVHPQTVPNFTINNDSQCYKGNAFTYTSTTTIPTGTIKAYNWTVGDGSTAQTTANATRTYATYGSYTVTLRTTSNYDCKDTTEQLVVVHPQTVPNFTINNDSQCYKGNAFTYTSTTTIPTGTIKSYNWTVGDGSTAQTTANATRTYATYGSYTVTLRTTSNYDCKDTTSQLVVVHPQTVPNFTINNDSQCYKGNAFTYTSTTTIPTGSINAYNWTVGDGSTAQTTANATRTYATYGSYTVTLRTTSNYDCKDTTSQLVVVHPQTVPNFTINNDSQCYKGNAFTYTSTTTIPTGTINAYNWTVGDGSTAQTTANATRTYATYGSYTVTLRTTSNYDCKDTTSQLVVVHPQTVPNFTINNDSQCYKGNAFTYTSTTTIPTGTINAYNWTVGDGSAAQTTANATRTYATYGSYTVTLRTTSNYDCKDTTSQLVVVHPQTVPNFTINNDSQCYKGNAFTYTSTTTIPTGTINAYNWTVGDGSAAQTTANATRTYATYGSYTVTLRTTSNYDCKDTTSQLVVVHPQTVPNFTINNDSQCYKGNQFVLTNNTTIPTGTVTKSEYIYGDSIKESVSGTANKSHIYGIHGSYFIRLATTSNYNCKDTTSPELVIVHPQTVPNFTINKDSQCTRDNKFVYTNTSTIPYTTIVKSKYNFGDNVTDAGTGLHNSEHRYTLTGQYSVSLFTETFYGCKDTIAKSITTMPQPKPIIVAQSKAICFGVDSFRLQQGGTNNAGSTFNWIVPTVGSKQGSTYSFQFNKYGDYTVRLIETSAFGCIDTVRQLLRSLPNPSARFAIKKTDTCLSGNLFKLAQDSVSIYPITQYRWVYSDNTSSALSTPQKHFASIGIHTVSLTVKDTNNCSASTTQQVEVYEIPKANFDINATAQCLKFNNYEFKSQATAGVGNIDSTWYFPSPNDKAKSGTTVSHVYANAGQQSVKMKVMNSKGCVDSLSKTIQVLPDPLVNFSINQSQQCINNQQFDLTNRTIVPGSTGSISYLWNLGDSATSTQTNVSKKYAYYGSKQVLLKATSVAGCWDTASQWIVVQPKPSAKFAINNDTQCVSTNQYNFTNQTTLVSGPWSIKNQSWNFGDGGFGATTNNATKKYNNFGSYSVRLIVTTSFGCADTTYQPVRVHPMPKVSYSVNNANQCLVGNDFQFSNSTSIVSGGGNITYQWKFGNGATTTNTNPSYSYATANTYAVRLIATSQFGCRDSITTNVKAVANPSVNFSINNANQCATTNQYTFSNTTNANNGSGLTYAWNMGDASTSTTGLNTTFTSSNANHQFAAAGDYRIKLVAVNNIGCTDSVIKIVSVKPMPKPAFDINQANQCQKGNQFVFTNQSTIGFGGGSLSAQWIFGDTTSSNTTNANKTFYQVRSYSIKLISSSSFGCKDSLTKFVTVRPMPAASFILNTLQQCLNENRLVTTNTSNISSGNLKYIWNLGDGSGSTVESPSKTYSKYGNYTVTLKAISDYNCVDSSKQNITIHSRPSAKFAISDTGQCLYQNEFTYTNQSTNADGSGLTYQWIFGDKTSSTLTSPKKSYKTEGDYPIRLAVTSAYGCTDSSSSLVRVYPQPAPNFIINNPGQCLTNNYFVASNYSYIGTRGGTLSYKWTFGDGRTRDSISPSWIYAKDDTFQVKLVVSSSLGCKDSASSRVIVYPQPKVAFNIPTPTQCYNGNKYEFQNNSTISSGILSYLWTFGNGITSSNPSPVLGYPDFGDYDVELFVRSTFGCQDSLTKSVRINPSPKADFVVNKDLQCERGNNFKITNFSSVAEGTNAYLWNFGDGKQSVAVQPNYTYAQYGEYKVRMVVTTDKGCKDSQQTKFVVKPNPDADFTINDTSQCAEQNDYIFLNNSNIAQGRFNSQWDLGDKNALLGLHARNTYAKQGTYLVKLKVSSAWGCSDSIIKPIYVRNQPIVEYTLDKSGACERENLFVTNNLSRVNDDTLYHRWEMGDGTNYSVQNTTHKYQKSGDYRIRLIVFSNYGCSDSLDTKVTVFPQGKSNVTIYDTAVCFRNNQVTMGNFSRVDKDLFLFQSWNFGDGKIDTTLTVVPRTYSYPDTGTYKVTLITTTQNFCTDTSYDFITVKPMPVVEIGSSSPSYCLNQQNFQFQSLTTGVPDQVINNWSFGDGIYQTGDNVSHLYRLPGSYKVQLISTSTFGCSDTAIYPVRVNALPIAAFTVNNIEQCQENYSKFTGKELNNFRFLDISQNTGANIFRFWKLGDGSVESNDTVIYSYDTSGLFNVELVLLDANGCSDTAIKTIVVHPSPEAALSVNPVCFGEFNEFYSNATITSGTITNRRWDFGDGTVAGEIDPKYRYTAAATYPVSLKVTSDKGCFYEYETFATVYPKPTAKIARPLRLVSRTATDTIYDGGFADINNPEYLFSEENPSADLTYEWDFGDGSDFSSDMFPAHQYGDTGIYTVSLTVTNSDGCSEFNQVDVEILPAHLILLPSAFSPNNDSHNDTYKPLGRFHSIRDYQITIHDANGLLVYQSNDILQAWNGKWNNVGEDAPAGMYEVSIAFIDVFQQKHVYNKRVTLVR